MRLAAKSVVQEAHSRKGLLVMGVDVEAVWLFGGDQEASRRNTKKVTKTWPNHKSRFNRNEGVVFLLERESGSLESPVPSKAT